MWWTLTFFKIKLEFLFIAISVHTDTKLTNFEGCPQESGRVWDPNFWPNIFQLNHTLTSWRETRGTLTILLINLVFIFFIFIAISVHTDTKLTNFGGCPPGIRDGWGPQNLANYGSFELYFDILKRNLGDFDIFINKT